MSNDSANRTPCPTISSAKVEGTKVYNAQGQRLGSIGELIIEKASGRVQYAVLEFGGFLGLGTDRYPLPWEQIRYDAAQDGYVVDLDKSVLEGAPRYPKLAEPEFTDEYNRKVYEYYSNP